MTVAIYLSVILVNFIYYLECKNKKKNNKTLIILSTLFIGMIYSAGINNVDMNYYDYNGGYSQTIKGIELGYYVILQICRRFQLGLVFERSCFFVVGYGFMIAALRKNCINIHLFLTIYMVILFPIDAVQMRFFVASSIVYFAFSYMYGKNKNIKKYIFWIVVAAMFQTSIIALLVLLVGELKYKKLWIKLVAASTIFLELVFVLNGRNDPFLGSLINFFLSGNGTRMFQYLSSNTNNGSLFVVLLILMNIILSWYNHKSLTINKQFDNYAEQSKYVFYFNLLQLFFIPLLWLSVEFYRFPRVLLFITIGTVVNTFVISTKLTKRKLNLVLLTLITVSFWFYMIYFRVSNFTEIFEPIFMNNLLNIYE